MCTRNPIVILNFEYFGNSASFMSVLRYQKIKKVEKTPQKHEKIETNQFNTDLIVSK